MQQRAAAAAAAAAEAAKQQPSASSRSVSLREGSVEPTSSSAPPQDGPKVEFSNKVSVDIPLQDHFFRILI
jgi:hypothetical protein